MPKNQINTKGVSRRNIINNFHISYTVKKIEFTLKESIQFHKIEFILNVSFEETLSTIFILVTYQKN